LKAWGGWANETNASIRKMPVSKIVEVFMEILFKVNFKLTSFIIVSSECRGIDRNLDGI
jgi:hypothetical protein